MDFDKMMTVDQVAEWKELTPIAVYKAIQSGKLKTYRLGGRLAIYSEDADAHWPNGRLKMGRPTNASRAQAAERENE